MIFPRARKSEARKSEARNSEQGYALLFIFALAASAAIMLYMELPRVIFEAQRDKEQLLIDRGEQFSRAVQLYVRKYQRFPTDMDALEKTQGIRFLRRKYVDPMTGKADWRLIHVGPGGQFTDSLVHNPKKDDKNAPQSFITEMQQIGGNGAGAASGVNIGTRTRASDQQPAGGNPSDPNAPQQQQQQAAAPINGPVMVLPDGRIVPANITGQAPAPNAPAQQQPGQQAGLQTPNGVAFQPGQNGIPGATPNGQPPAAAANLINQLLTSPRPVPGQPVGETAPFSNGGAPGTQNALPAGFQNTANTGTALSSTLGNGQTIGGGFAGVASKLEQEGIKSYGDRTAYNEWEFVYDITRDPTRNPQQGLNRLPTQNGQQNQQAAPAGGAAPK